MKTPRGLAVACFLGTILIALPAVCASQDVEGSRDHPLFNRMPDYYIDQYKEQDFDAYDSFVGSDGGYMTVEGHKYYINYYFKEGTQYKTEAFIIRNYREAFKKIGGVVLYEDRSNIYMKLDKGGKVTWVHVSPWNGGQGIGLNIIEEQAMEQVIVADAEALFKEISLTGKVAVYGIYFDTGKAVVKPESDPALEEIVKLLTNQTGLKIYVVGHTDSVGAFDYNMNLSQKRAEAVVQVLVSRFSVAADRLKPYGVGPLVPSTSNRSEDGRAKNRRVELVEQ